MVVVNSGSIADSVYNSISPLASNLSGLILSTVNEKIYFIEQYTGYSVGTTAIEEKYQSCIEHLALAHIISLMAIQDNGVSEVRVDNMVVRNENLAIMAKSFEEDGMFKLRSLAKTVKFYKARG
jgi:hypothetical protein